MIETGRTYRHPRNGVEVTVLHDEPERYEIRLVHPTRLKRSRPHVHTDFQQEFVVEEGVAQLKVGRTRHQLGAGERLTLPRGTLHVDPWNDGPRRLVFHNVITPTPRFIPVYVDAVVTALAEGRLADSGDLPLLQVAVLVEATDAKSYGAGPIAPQRAMLPVFAALGRRRGYRAPDQS